ncbi:hypothetical protein BDQ12DRAFT_324972 [Crucibulum laeve]|uniref:Uncharacterized protein n=1 Tax=Crucibulum laeve TaxID=68775 RepID=A0A5C3LRB5_9AGAR|nr:hypothetical protein BDQ12DRAFT_324972 [Crucibulum laeve]
MPLFHGASGINIRESEMSDVAGNQYNGQTRHHQGDVNHGDQFHGPVSNRGVLGVRGNNARPVVNNNESKSRKRAPTPKESDSDNEDEDEDPAMANMKRMLDEACKERDEARAKCADLEKQLQLALAPKKTSRFGRKN